MLNFPLFQFDQEFVCLSLENVVGILVLSICTDMDSRPFCFLHISFLHKYITYSRNYMPRRCNALGKWSHNLQTVDTAISTMARLALSQLWLSVVKFFNIESLFVSIFHFGPIYHIYHGTIIKSIYLYTSPINEITQLYEQHVKNITILLQLISITRIVGHAKAPKGKKDIPQRRHSHMIQ